MTIKILNEIEVETRRFLKRLIDAKLRLSVDDMAGYGCKETGAVKRAALDLKNELTRITK